MVFFLLTDEGEGQRKRKGEEEEEKQPAKRQSLGTDKVPVPPEVADATASALQNLAIEKKSEGQQVDPDTPTDEQPSSGRITSEQSPDNEEIATGCQSAGRVIGPFQFHTQPATKMWRYCTNSSGVCKVRKKRHKE